MDIDDEITRIDPILRGAISAQMSVGTFEPIK